MIIVMSFVMKAKYSEQKFQLNKAMQVSTKLADDQIQKICYLKVGQLDIQLP